MAFKMNRPVIKGTPLHKASIAKAKESIVSQRRTQADGALVQAAEYLGKSYIPQDVDFSITSPDLAITKQDLEDAIKGSKKAKKKVVDNYTKEDPEFTDEEIQADLDRITKEDGKNTKPKKKKYKNWKEREREENIRLAEENKARLDAATAEKAKADAEANKNNTNFDYNASSTNDDIVAPETEEFNPSPKSDVRVMTKKERDYNEYATSRGFDMATEKGRKQAAEELEYNETQKKWEHPRADAGDVVANEAAEALMKKEKQRLDTERQNKLDKNQAERNIKASAKEDERLKKEAEREKKNKAIRERNEARKYFKGKTNQPKTVEEKVLALRKIKATQQAELESTPDEIIEQDDPEPGNIAYDGNNNGMPDYLEVKSPMQMRDDRIYRNAQVDGPVRRNMIKSCLLYTSPSPRDRTRSRMPSSA